LRVLFVASLGKILYNFQKRKSHASIFIYEEKTFACMVCASYFLTLISGAVAAEKNFLGDGRDCNAVLLTNEEFFPVLVQAIEEARHEIWIAIFSFKTGVHPNSFADRLAAALSRAAKKGVNVSVILENSGNPHDELDIQNQRTGKYLATRGIHVYFDNPHKTTHTKLVVIDEKIVMVGSHNFTQSGLKYNNEVSILLQNKDVARKARNYIFKIIREGQ